jgi:hypothetical protein
MPSKANPGGNQPFAGPNASALAAGAIRPAVKLKTAEQSQFREAMNALADRS